MRTALIVGSGAAAASTANALSHQGDISITVIDIGLRLEPERQQVIDAVSRSKAPLESHDLELIAQQPVASGTQGLPQKRVYGSDFPFRDVGQLLGITPDESANDSLVSGAYGGFTNVWGAQVMPFADSVFDTWPVSATEMRPHYQHVLKEIPFAAEEDDLADHFPIIGPAAPLPRVSERTGRVLDAYAAHRSTINRIGLTLGRARLAFDAAACVRCGLCMTGCPYGLIYSASHTFDKLRANGQIRYLDGLMALEVGEDGREGYVAAENLSTGQRHVFRADRVFVACGAVGTTRLVLNSRRLFEVDVKMGEAQQFMLPLLSLRPTNDPRREPLFTLNQFNVTASLDAHAYDLSQLHVYTYNPAFINAFPRILQGRVASRARAQLLRRLSVALGYLPSWRSPTVLMRVGGPTSRLPQLSISGSEPPAGRRGMLRAVLGRLARAAPRLDLYPVLPLMRLSGAGKSYHVGGSFPHVPDVRSTFGSDRLGRVGGWSRVHLTDASVFPSVPATTFTLTVMANAHRIASEAIGLEP